MGTFTKGEVVLFPFPYTDLTSRKIRPCLVISEGIGEDLVLCQITSKKVKNDSFSVNLNKNETVDGTLSIDSLIRTNMIFTANKTQILKKVCKIKDKNYSDVCKNIIKLISK